MMSWNLNDNRPKLLFKEPFSTKYTLHITTSILSGGIELNSKAEIRWQVDIKNINDKGEADLNIITLHHRLLENNSPIISDMSGISNVFASMYNEIEVQVDSTGKILKVYNLDTIKKKWSWVKKDMEALLEQNEGFKDMILTNDELYSSSEKIQMAIEANEFFEVYFNHFWGRSLPGGKSNINKFNLFSTSPIEWRYDFRSVHNSTLMDDVKCVRIKGTPVTIIDKNWVGNAYSAFAHLQLKKTVPILEDKAEYLVTSFGKIIHASIKRQEIVDPELLFAKYSYELFTEDKNELDPFKESVNG
ncbi:hypothetical protein BBI01_01300 [Chryseobacterium artocarpi]|uniref:Uncharacterized protein n=1 Tax=Chryseobacterium artocarpi TaxID=1414727 RepID=A0A1B8ZZW0_9FLAO|nr:hypothetical protein [Chryseobacterium artocarpi]OCA77127.1 hypothetical protein BBI01_01300 [Chryseobacterium artocarpi]